MPWCGIAEEVLASLRAMLRRVLGDAGHIAEEARCIASSKAMPRDGRRRGCVSDRRRGRSIGVLVDKLGDHCEAVMEPVFFDF